MNGCMEKTLKYVRFSKKTWSSSFILFSWLYDKFQD